MDSQTISIVIPLCNKAAHVKRAVDSVLAQTVTDWELVVVDDGSTDGGGDIVKQFTDPRIKYIRQDNQGVSSARNKGIKAARAELVAFLDADDEWLPKFLETILRLRAKFPQAGLYCTAYSIVERDGIRRTPEFKSIPAGLYEGLLPSYFESALGQPPVSASSAAVPKMVFEKAGFFPVGVTFGEDLDTWFRIALQFKIAFSNRFLAVYYRNTENGACAAHPASDNPFILARLRSALNTAAIGNIPREEIMRYHDFMLFGEIRQNLWRGNKENAHKLLALHLTCGKNYFSHYILCNLPGHLGRYLLSVRQSVLKLKSAAL